MEGGRYRKEFARVNREIDPIPVVASPTAATETYVGSFGKGPVIVVVSKGTVCVHKHHAEHLVVAQPIGQGGRRPLCQRRPAGGHGGGR